MVQIHESSESDVEAARARLRLAREYHDEQAALSLLHAFRSRRPLRHNATLESNLQDLLDEWYRRE